MLSIALALFMCVGMLTCIVLPAAATETSYAAVWAEYGLAPKGTETYVDVSTQALYAARDGGNGYGFVTVATDWKSYAYKTYEGAVNATESDQFTSSDTTERVALDATPVEPTDGDFELKYGDIFYAKMPTTGIVYKLTYGITAGDVKKTNIGTFATVVFFPGTYTASGYSTSNEAYLKEYKYTFSTTEQEGAFGVAYRKNSHVLAYNASEFRILGPWAGVSASDVENGKLSDNRKSATNEAVISGTYFYIMNGALDGNGDSATIDGFTLTDSANIKIIYKGANEFSTNNNTTSINVQNCNIYDVNEENLFLLVAYNTSGKGSNGVAIDSSIANNIAKGNLALNIDGSYIRTQAGNYALASANVDGIHIADSVIDHSASTSSYAFRINAVTADNNANSHAVSYACENSYVKMNNKASLFTFEGNATSGLSSSTRTGISFAIKNNKMADCVQLVNIVANENAAENTAMAAITDVIVTGNTVSGSGALLASYDAAYALRSVNVSNNAFTGIATDTSAAFTGFADTVDFANNVYKNGDTVISAKVASGKVTDIVLDKDFKIKASDFKITEGATKVNLNWTNAGTDAWADLNTVGNVTAEIPFVTTGTAEDLTKNLTFASDKVSVVGLTYADGTAIGAADTFDLDTTAFKLTLKHSDSDKTLSYKLTFACPHTEITNSTEAGAYLAPTCGAEGYQKGTCNRCYEAVTKKIPATGNHTTIVIVYAGQEPTCYQTGLGYTYCTSCEQTVDENTTVDPTDEHSYDVYNWSSDATGHWHACTTAGCTARSNFAAHTPSVVVAYEGKAPTCYQTGEGYIYCEDCGYVTSASEVMPATGEHVYTTEPSFDNNGHWYVCTVEGCDAKTAVEAHIISDVIPYGDMRATCTAAGMGYKNCTVCGAITATNITIPATGHPDGKWETVAAANYLKEGLQQRVCVVCGEFFGETRKIAKINKVDVLAVFDDISASDWFYKNGSADFAYNLGLFTGTNKTTFSPNGVVTRGMFVTVLGRLHGVEVAKTTLTKFTDIQKTAYYAGYVKWASDNNIVLGVTDYAFAPNSSITREQMCTILVRYCNYAGIALKESEAAVTFTDAASISGYAKDAVAVCQKAGLVQGKGAGKFDPKGTATRAEAATILMNFYLDCIL